MSSFKNFSAQGGNAIVIVLVALVAVAGGGMFYMSQQNSGETGVSAVANAQPASGEAQALTEAAQAAAEDQIEIRPGDPVVAKLKGQDIKRSDVLRYMQNLPPNLRQLPIQQVFSLSLDQVINTQIVDAMVGGVNLDDNPVVKAQLEEAKKGIVRNVYMQQEAEKALTDKRLQSAYEEYKAGFPEVEEIKTRHILVADEALAKDLIERLKGGADFAALAQEHSTDATKENGGDLGYLSQQEQVLPAFLDALYALEVGTYTQEPVQTDVGFHIIEAQEKRMRPPATFEQAKPFLAAQLRGVVLNELVQNWREQAEVEVYDINGDAIEPAAGE